MPSVRMIAKKVVNYAGRQYAVGEVFMVRTGQHARTLRAIGQAVLAPDAEYVPAPVAPPVPVKPKPAPRRAPAKKAMKAEAVTPVAPDADPAVVEATDPVAEAEPVAPEQPADLFVSRGHYLHQDLTAEDQE